MSSHWLHWVHECNYWLLTDLEIVDKDLQSVETVFLRVQNRGNCIMPYSGRLQKTASIWWYLYLFYLTQTCQTWKVKTYMILFLQNRDHEKSVNPSFALHPKNKDKMTEPPNFLKINIILCIRNIPSKSTFPQRLRFQTEFTFFRINKQRNNSNIRFRFCLTE